MTSTPPAYPPGAPAAPASTPKKKGWLKWVAIGCGGVLVLGALFGVAMFFVVRKATAGPERAVAGFLAAAGSGNYSAAYDYFSAPLKQVQSLDEFTRAAQSQPIFFQVTDTTFSDRSIDLNGARLAGSVTLKSGTKIPASFKLVKENGAWKLISYEIGS
ncbi:MAG: hypothetical protein ACRD1B_05120 [Thermoanaerobaculia bacterium]